jgi:hypothetical protein
LSASSGPTATAKPARPVGQQHQQLPNRAPRTSPPPQQQQQQQRPTQQAATTASKLHFGIEKLREMFPDEPPSVLQAALTSFNGDTQKAIDVLLQRDQHRQATLRQPKVKPRRSSSFSGKTAPQLFTPGGQAPLPVFHRERTPSEIAVIKSRIVNADDDLSDFDLQAALPTISSAGIHYEGLPSKEDLTGGGGVSVLYEQLPAQRSTSDPPIPHASVFTAGMTTPRGGGGGSKPLAYVDLPDFE